MANEIAKLKTAVRIWLAGKRKTQAWLATRMRMTESELSKTLMGFRPLSDPFVTKLRRITAIDAHDYVSSREAVSR